MSIAFSAAAACALPRSALAQELLFHLPLDGSLQNVGAAGGEAALHVKAGDAPPTSVAGKFGEALHFTGGAALALPYSLSPEDHPQVTITAWVKLDPGYKGEHAVVSSGNGNGPKLTLFSGKALLTAGRSTATFAQAMPKDKWVFIAGVADISNAQARVYQGGGELIKENIKTGDLYPPTAYKDPDDPDAAKTPYLFVGSHGFNQWTAKDMSIDDVRVYAGALTKDQLDELRNASSAANTDVPGAQSANDAPEKKVDDVAPSSPGMVGDIDKQAPAGVRAKPVLGSEIDPKALPGDQYDSAAPGTPPYVGAERAAALEKTSDLLRSKKAETTPPDIPYGSKEEALAAADKRARERGQAELDRQQNELEEQRRAAASTTEQENPEKKRLFPYPVGEASYSKVSGEIAGGIRKTLDLASSGGFLTEIWWGEKFNRPCRVSIRGVSIIDPSKLGGDPNAEENWYDFHHSKLDFDCPAGDSGFKHRVKTAGIINSVKVCDNKGFKYKLKGIRIGGARLNPDGSISETPIGDEEMLPNCRYWNPKVSCPADELATGIVVYATDRTGNNEDKADINTMQLICHKVGMRPTP